MLEVLWSIVREIVQGLFPSFLVAAYDRSHSRFYAFWGIKKQRNLHVVCGGYQNIDGTKNRLCSDGTYKPKIFNLNSPVSQDEYEPFGEILKAFAHEHKADIVLSSDEKLKNQPVVDMICIGGQQSNNKTYKIFHFEPLNFQPVKNWPEGKGQFLEIQDQSWKIPHNEDNVDYAIILKTRNPDGYLRAVIAGFSNWGTRGGTVYLRHHWHFIYKKISWWRYWFPFCVTVPGFLCILKFPNKEDYHNAKLIGLYAEGKNKTLRNIIPVEKI